MNKKFLQSKKAVMTLVGILFAVFFIVLCFFKPELIALQYLASTVILSVIGHGAFQGWVDAKQSQISTQVPDKLGK